MKGRMRLLACLLTAAVALSLLAQVAFAQSVPMMFTGTATAGTTIVAYSAAGTEVGRSTTGAQGQAANAWTMLINNPALEDQDIFFYLVTAGGVLLPRVGTQTPVTARYDVVGGPGRANVPLLSPTGVAQAEPAAAQAWRQQTQLSLPFSGTAYVSQGWNGEKTHQGKLQYSVDFIVLDVWGSSYRGSGKALADYYMWEKPVLAPADGVVAAMENAVPDSPLNEPDRERPAGNYVIIDHQNGEFSQIDHFKQSSIVVRQGEAVRRGQVLGLAGNSGLSYEPHIHYQLQDRLGLEAMTLPATFASFYQVVGYWQYLRSNQTPQEGTLVRSAPTARSSGWISWRMLFPTYPSRTILR